MGDVDPLKLPSSASIMCLEHFKFNPNSVHRYLPKIT